MSRTKGAKLGPHPKSQEGRIEAYLLLPGHSLTPLEALHQFGCMRLASVMHRLKVRHTVAAEIVSENGKTFARYTMQAGKQLDLLDVPVTDKSPQQVPLDDSRLLEDAAEIQSENEARVRAAVKADADSASMEELECAADMLARLEASA